MSTPRTSIAVVAALLVLAVTATAAQARPDIAVDRSGTTSLAKHHDAGAARLPSGHHAAPAGVTTHQPLVAVAKSGGSTGVSQTAVFGLMGLALLAGAAIAIWAAARTGHVTREGVSR
jgi:hypothetical protein